MRASVYIGAEAVCTLTWGPDTTGACLSDIGCLRGRASCVVSFSPFPDLATDGSGGTVHSFLPRTLRRRWNFANVSRIASFPIRGNS